MKSLLRNLGLGRVLLALYHRPVGRARDSLRNGGPFAERETERQRLEMVRAADGLGALPQWPGAPTLTVHLMTGRRFWYQTLFCLHSLSRTSAVNVVAEIYDDGTIDDRCRERLLRLGPVRIHGIAELTARRDAGLPPDRFPCLRDRWEKYPNIRKLIDVHLGSQGWKLVIDSDLLFFAPATELLAWQADPRQPLVATDCEESYGYSRPLMESLAGGSLPALVNVGLCGLNSSELDWGQLESWTAELQRRERTNYYLEQALVAMLLPGRAFTQVSAERYITRPTRQQVQSGAGVMQHYVAESKRWYFRQGWRSFV